MIGISEVRPSDAYGVHASGLQEGRGLRLRLTCHQGGILTMSRLSTKSELENGAYTTQMASQSDSVMQLN